MTNRSIKYIAVVVLLVAVGLGFASYTTSRAEKARQQAKAREEEQAEIGLLTDPVRSGSEIESRLRTHLAVGSGVVTAGDTYFGFDVFSFPASTAWFVTCGSGGLQLSFDLTEDASIQISDATLDFDLCRTIAPIVAERVRRLLAES